MLGILKLQKLNSDLISAPTFNIYVLCIFMATFTNQPLCHSTFHSQGLPFWLNCICHLLVNGMIFGEKILT